MDITTGLIIGLVVGLVIGFLLMNVVVKRMQKSKVDEMNKKADLTIQEAKITAKRIQEEAKSKANSLMSNAESKHDKIKQRKIKEAKEKFANLKSRYESEKAENLSSIKDREREVKTLENDLQRKVKDLEAEAEGLETKESEVKAIKDNLEKQIKVVSKRKEELENANDKFIKQLETIAKMSESEAKDQLLDAVKAKAETAALSIEKDIVSEATATANKQAKKIVIQAIQRMCAEYTIENTVSVFNLDSDDIKGQIIGREGRNIRAIEAATGAELVVDDTPEAIVISSFDPIRREICRLSLKRLVADGRIHPAKIEETVAKVKKQLNEQIMEIGERTVIDLDLHGLNPYLIKMVGRMRFRSSYGQNLLKHSIETAHLCAAMGAELGLSSKQIKLAKRAGLLHDIGKVAEEDSELPHALLGMQICEKYKEHPVVLNAVGAHHDEIESQAHRRAGGASHGI